MADNCTFTYKGKNYSKDRLIRQLVNELPARSQQESIAFLVDFLGMSESEILTVKGLIDNKSLGRFKMDGRILLSDLATVDVAYHEAFHRAWRMYLTTEERLQAIKEIKNRKGIQSVIDQYVQIYPKLSENELLEEILADEFADYTLNVNYKVELPIKSLFQRLLNFLKKLMGLNANQIQTIYDKILSKSFAGKPMSAQQYLKDADKLLIQGVEFTIEQKNEFIQSLTQKTIRAMLEVNGDVDALINNPTVKMKNLIDEGVIANMLSDIMDNVENSEDLLTAIYEDVEKWLTTNDSKQSIFINGLYQNLRLLGLEIKDETEDDTEGALDSEEKQSREYTSSIELDPSAKIGKKIKLLLASLSEASTTSNFGFNKPVSWKRAFMQISTRMAGIPTSVFMQEMKNLDLPYIKQLTDILEKDSIFQNKFISTMAMTENKFETMNHKDGDIYFFDANSGTKKDKLLNEWQGILIRNMEDWNAWLDEVKDIKSRIQKVDNFEILLQFGITVNSSIEHSADLQAKLHLIIDKVSKYEKGKPDSKKIFQDLGIRGYVTDIADKQSVFEDQVDAMVNVGVKKLYAIGLNTQQTTVLNAIKYAQSKFTPEMTTGEKIELIKKFAEFQVNEFNVTKLENGEYIIHNEWLRRILNGESLDLVIPYAIKTEEGEMSEISKLDEADLMSLHINATLQGRTMSMKHADRSTFFAYKFDKPLYSLMSVEDSLRILTDNLEEQIRLEAKFVNDMRELKLPIQYLGKNFEELAFGSIIGKDEFEKALKGEPFSNVEIRKLVRTQYEQFRKKVEEYGLLDDYETPLYKDGKKKGSLTRVKGINNSIVNSYVSQDVNVRLDSVLASAFVNEVSSHIFETRFFSGDVRAFKNGADLFKRLSPQSSNGLLTVNSADTHVDVRNRLNQEFEILNPLTGEFEKVNPTLKIGLNKDKYFRGVTLAERENYVSHLLDPATTLSGKPIISKFTGKSESKMFLMYEDQFRKDFPDKTDAELSKTYLSKIRSYEDKYKNMNENDGISYMTLPAFKKFMIKQGDWTDGMELVYQVEMKIASLASSEDIANIEVEIKGVKFKPFEVKASEVNGKKYDGWKKRIVDGKLIKLDAVHTLKTQFGGYSTPEEYFNDAMGEMKYTFNSVFKTSQHLLQPSAIINTNLQLMNFSLLKNGIDIAHMGSANKVGGVDPKLAAKNVTSNANDKRNGERKFLQDIAERGLDFYDKSGNFNHAALDENVDILTYLSDWDFLKNQVAIGNKVKQAIKGSTQSLKIMLSNLVVNGQERFLGAQDLIDSYKKVVRSMVENNHDSTLERIGFDIDSNEFTSLDQLKQAVLGSSQMQNAPENIRNSVENFFEDPNLGIEAIPMRNKIENVLYALITNGIISFDRPGTSYPQAAVTGYEKLNSRKFDENGLQKSNQDTLKFYNPVFDEEGNVTSVEPAEIIMPLPDTWIPLLLRWAKTNNLVKALDMLNADIAVRPELYQFKGLRIPNQQLSSNDFFQVKKFNLPTMQNYVLIPSEMVIKTGGDFDIDKLNIYWASDTQDKIFGKISDEDILDQYDVYKDAVNETGISPMSFEEFYKDRKKVDPLGRELLNLEKEILLHPRNSHHLLMPLTDEVFVQDIYNKLVAEGLISTSAKSYFASLLPQVNVRNTVIFVKGKFGVGVVALGITNKSTNQADTLVINQNFNNQEGVTRKTQLLFSGLESNYRLDSYTDNKGTIVSEIQSQLLSTQVDNVKNPTAVLMNINMQTLNVMDYLIRRGVNPETIILLLNQPLVKAYLEAQKNNESFFNKNAKSEVGKKELIENLLKKNGYSRSTLPDPYTLEEGDTLEITDENLRKSIKDNKFDKTQAYLLNYFLELQDQGRAFSDFQSSQTSDTKTFKDKQMSDEAQVVRGRLGLSQIVSPDDVARLDSRGVISPFYQFGRQRYSVFDRFYSLASSRFGGLLFNFKNQAAIVAKASDKDRVRQTIENDFIVFLVHRYVTNKNEFDRLTKDKSVAKRVQDLKIKLPQNAVLKALFPLLNNTTDRTDNNKKIDSLRLFEKDLDQLDSQDLAMSLEELSEMDIDLYNDIIKLTMFQTGLTAGVFNYRTIVPVGLNSKRNEFNEHQYVYQDMLTKAVEEMNKDIRSMTDVQVKAMFQEFINLFSANNIQFLKKNFRHSEYPYTLAKVWNRESMSWQLVPEKGKSAQVQLGDAYHKQYFPQLFNLQAVVVKPKTAEPNLLATEETEVQVPQVSNPGKFTFSYKGTTIDTEFQLGEDQIKALENLIDFVVSGNTMGNKNIITLQGAAGSGKTSIIGYLQKYFKTKRFLYLAPTHAAVAELAFSTVKAGNSRLPMTVQKSIWIDPKTKTAKFSASASARIGLGSVIVVDESSMLDDKDVKNLMEASAEAGARLIYMGDEKQIPKVDATNPKSKPLSPAFTLYKQLRLNKIFRQSENTLLSVLGEIRKQTDFKLFKPETNTASIAFVEKRDFDERYEQSLKTNPEGTVIIAYTNNAVQQTNSVARELLGRTGDTVKGDIIIGYLGYASKQIEKGDIANSIQYRITDIQEYGSERVIKAKSKKLSNLTELGVQGIPDDAITTYYQLSTSDSLTFSKLKEADFANNNNNVARFFRILHKNNVDYANKAVSYFSYLDTIAGVSEDLRKISVGNDYVYNPETDRMEKYDATTHRGIKTTGLGSLLMNKDIDYGHAITIHKSQGATIDNVFFDASSLRSASNTPIVDSSGKQITTEKQALAYVAMSRSKNQLVVYASNIPFDTIGNSRKNSDQVTQPANSKSEIKSSIVKNNWTKDSPKENPNTAYIFTENINSIGSSRGGGGSAVIRNNPNAIGIVTKKYYVYAEDRATSKVTGGWNQDFQNTEADFELFKKVNLEQFAKIDKYETKIFPQGFASDLAKIPTRFAEWLQNELLNRYGLVTELNSNKTGLISKSVKSTTSINQPVQPTKETPKISNTVKTLPMQPDNIEQIRAGTKTITNRTAKIDDGTYKLPDGTLVEITYVGEANVTEQGIEINGQIREKDNFAKAEGFKDWNDFKQNNKFSENFINGKQSRFIHKIDTFQSIFELDKSQSNYSPSLKMYEGFINLNQLYTGEEILPLIGESEYYRYLVPMLLNMNPKAQTMFTQNIGKAAVDLGIDQNLPIDYLSDLSNLNLKRTVRGASFNTMNTNFVKEGAKTKTVIHELVHLTLQKEYEKGTEFKRKIDELYGYAWDRQVTNGTYGFTSPKEFLAEAMSNPDFMEELNDIQYQDETVWSYLMTLVSDFINNLLNIELKSDSVLAEVVRQSEQVLNNNAKEMSKDYSVDATEVQKELVENWNNYFPQYDWMSENQKLIAAKLVEEGKLTLTCKI